MKDHRQPDMPDSKRHFPVRGRRVGYFLCLAISICGAICGMSGCASSAYRYGRAENYHSSPELAAIRGDQIERGQPRPVLDGIGWVIGIPSKIILWDHRVDNHAVSPETEIALAKYLDDNELENVKVRVNQYAPREEWRRLVANKSVGAGWRYTLGTLSWVGYTILPGRVFGGDNYNPFTNTIHVYSDAPALVLHEGGHAKDFSRRKLPGTYAAVYALVPFTPLYYEAVATGDALKYLRTEGTAADEQEAYRLLYPAYGTYVGGAFGGSLFAIVAGHVVGRVEGSQVPREREADEERVAAIREQHHREMAAKRSSRQNGKWPTGQEPISPSEKVAADPVLAQRSSVRGKRKMNLEAATKDVESVEIDESAPIIQPAGHTAISSSSGPVSPRGK
ncbi:MAG: hypothetical protein JWM11_5050 [Planctomycetaceae bacterium]|nr:hypothetical protein [Planctomycetaceae bacterium]